MRDPRALLALLLALGSSPALADDPHTRYQNELLRRPLSAGDESVCRQKAGSAREAFDRCHVTRNFLADIARKAEQGFPPLTDLRYVLTKDEKNALLDKLTAFGG